MCVYVLGFRVVPLNAACFSKVSGDRKPSLGVLELKLAALSTRPLATCRSPGALPFALINYVTP